MTPLPPAEEPEPLGNITTGAALDAVDPPAAEAIPDREPAASGRALWMTRGTVAIGGASLLSDLGHEVPASLLPSLLTSTLHAPASAVGLIEGIADALAGLARLGGGALADDPHRRRGIAIGGYGATAILSSLIGVAGSVWQVGVLRAGAWTARGLRVPARNALLADVVPVEVYGRAYGFERAMDNLGAILGPLLGIVLVALAGVRGAILISVIPGLLAAGAILHAIRHTPRPAQRVHQPIRLQIRPVLQGRLRSLLFAIGALEERARRSGWACAGRLSSLTRCRQTRALPLVVEMRHPVARPNERHALAVDRVCRAHAVGRGAQASFVVEGRSWSWVCSALYAAASGSAARTL